MHIRGYILTWKLLISRHLQKLIHVKNFKSIWLPCFETFVLNSFITPYKLYFWPPPPPRNDEAMCANNERDCIRTFVRIIGQFLVNKHGLTLGQLVWTFCFKLEWFVIKKHDLRLSMVNQKHSEAHTEEIL